MRGRHRHRHAAQEIGEREQAEHQIWRQAEHRSTRNDWLRRSGHGCRRLGGRLAQENQRQWHHNRDDNQAIDQHGLAPAHGGHHALEDRRPDRAGDVLPAGDHRQGGAAPAVEPLGNVDHERRIDAGVAEQPDEQPVTDVQLPDLAVRREQQSDADHPAAEHDRPAHADALGDGTHGDATDGRAEPGKRVRKRRDRALPSRLGRNRLKRDAL